MNAALTNSKPYDLIDYFIKKGGPKPDEYELLNNAINFIATNPRDDIKITKKHFSEGFLKSTIQGLSMTKTFGYAGDYNIIDKIYTNHVCENEKYKNWDIFFHSHSAVNAVRNRKEYFKEILIKKINNQTSELTLLNIASGPARDLLELYNTIGLDKLKTTCIEHDQNAIQYAENLTINYCQDIEFLNYNIFKYKTSSKHDVIWSAGLFDYLNDKLFVKILKKLLNWLKPDGEIIIGNFSTSNPSKNYMELFGEWYLEHRDESKLIQLAKQAGATEEQIQICKEKEGINLFLHIKGCNK